MPRAFLIKKKVPTTFNNNNQHQQQPSPAHSPKLFSPNGSTGLGSPVSSPISSTSSFSSSSPSNDENINQLHYQQQHQSSMLMMQSAAEPKYSFVAAEPNQCLDLSMKSLLKEQQSNKPASMSPGPVSPSSTGSEYGSFVSRHYPYPGKLAKIAEFFRNSEIAKLQAAAAVVSMSNNKNIDNSKQMTHHHHQSEIITNNGSTRMAPYSINWSEHFSVHQVNVLSPTPSSDNSDDSGRGSESQPEDSGSLNTSPEMQRLKAVAERYKCSVCHKCYSTQGGLAKHLEHHCHALIQKSFSCKHCEKVYVSLGALKMHIRTHTLPCKCKICGKAFSRPWLLQGKLRITFLISHLRY